MPETEKDLALDLRRRGPDVDREGRTGCPEAFNSREGVEGLPPDVFGLAMSNDDRMPLKSRLALFMDRDRFKLEKPKSENDSEDSCRSCCLLLLSIVVPLEDTGLALCDIAELVDALGELTRTGIA